MDQKVLSKKTEKQFDWTTETKLISTEQITLRSLHENDIKSIYNNLVLDKIVQNYSKTWMIHESIEQIKQYVAEKTQKHHKDSVLIINDALNGDFVGAVLVDNVNLRRKECEIECAFARNYLITQYPKDGIKSVMTYLINKLKLKKIWTSIFEPDWAMRKFLVDLNFEFDLKKSLHYSKLNDFRPYKQLWFCFENEEN